MVSPWALLYYRSHSQAIAPHDSPWACSQFSQQLTSPYPTATQVGDSIIAGVVLRVLCTSKKPVEQGKGRLLASNRQESQ